MLRMLSYPLDPDTPTFMRHSPPGVTPLQSMDRRGNVNMYLYHLHSNVGTHLIAPRHVHPDGYDVAALPPERFHFQRPVVVDIPLSQTYLIGESDLAPHAEAIGQADLLLVRTGFGRTRRDDPRAYGTSNPGFDVSAAIYLIDKFPDLKGVGMDFPYPSSAHHLSRGLAFQQVILGASNRERFILLIADLNLEGDDLDRLAEVWALPLRIAGGPAAPCTVIGRLREPEPEPAGAESEGEAPAEGEAS